MDNILYSNEGKTESDIENCLKKYNIEKLMDKFQHGLDTRINKDKSGLSLGQMQIISFLRGILVRKNVLVLDEPFANLDKDAKKIIIEALKNIDLADILIIISHDEDELDFANKVIYVDQ
jgi:ABC-type bacteriocin/lantibiotic exporter with double-glycine peptidase domain